MYDVLGRYVHTTHIFSIYIDIDTVGIVNTLATTYKTVRDFES